MCILYRRRRRMKLRSEISAAEPDGCDEHAFRHEHSRSGSLVHKGALWRALMICGVLLLGLAAPDASKGQGAFTFLQTGSDSLSATVPLGDLGNGMAELAFVFGFSTDEDPLPGQFLDALTATLADEQAMLYLPIMTVDRAVIVWAPGGEGTVPLEASEILRNTIPYPGSVPALAASQAWQVRMQIPALFQDGSPVLYFDLFDNAVGPDSLAWFGNVTVTAVPEPGRFVLAGFGFLICVLWMQRRTRH